MHEIALALLNASISADTRARLPLAVAFVREVLMRQDPDGYARELLAALADASAAAVEQIEAPVLLVTGDEDVVAPPQAVRAMAEKLHRARSVPRRRAAQVRALDTGRAGRGMPARVARVLGRRRGDADPCHPRVEFGAARRAVPVVGSYCGGRPCRPTPLCVRSALRGETRYAHFVRVALEQSPSSQRWKHARCARAERAAAMLAAPQVAPTGHRPPRSSARGVRRGIP